MAPIKIFVSYAHENATYKDELLMTCSVLSSSKKIDIWTDDDIRAGDTFEEVLKQQIEQSDMYILLLSSIYWGKPYINDEELPKILDVAKQNHRQIIPIVLNGANRIKHTPLNGKSLFPIEANILKAIDDFDQKHKAWDLIFEEIEKIIDRYEKSQTEEISKNSNIVEICSGMEAQKISIPSIAILTPFPIDGNVNYSFSAISHAFKKYGVEVYEKVFNEEALYELDEFDYIIMVTNVNKDKLIIEDENFTEKLMTLQKLHDILQGYSFNGAYLFVDDPSQFQINDLNFDVHFNDSNIKHEIQSFLHKELRMFLSKGGAAFHRLKTQLPEQIDEKNLHDFVGRATDIENIIRKALTVKENHKVLTVKGSGGIGKTTLVTKVMVEMAKRGCFKEGISFIDCEFLSSYADVESKIAIAFELTNAMNFRQQLQYLDETDSRAIILDNFETLLIVEESQRIKELIKDISDYATIIITTREKLDISYEDFYPLNPITTDEAEELFLKLFPLEEYDQKVLRTEILENLLNNNPLAIKLVTKNAVPGKNLDAFYQDLQENFFESTSNEEIELLFDRESDLNIERSKSLYNSINYSYIKLTYKEQLAFELLSLFPDGIHFRDFIIFYNTKEEKTNPHKILERDIVALENKSLIIISNEFINLQSIIARFADRKFQQRPYQEQQEYFKRAFNYNNFIISNVIMQSKDKSVQARKFDKNKNNFIKSINYINDIPIHENVMFYLAYIFILLSRTSSPQYSIIKKFSEMEEYFNDREDLKKLFKIRLTALEYFWGDFRQAFEKIQLLQPYSEILGTNVENRIQLNISAAAMNIYWMEGYYTELIEFELKNLKYLEISGTYYLNVGLFNLIKKYKSQNKITIDDFFLYEFNLNCNQLNVNELHRHIKKLYKTEFIEKIQSIYTMVKYNSEYLGSKEIEKLVETNPYTYGLKQLMLAFVEKNTSKAKQFFQSAFKNLEHIKYYYVEALYFYAKFLKEINDDEYNNFLEIGKSLSLRHFYRFHQHRFYCLEYDLVEEYDENKYPLPPELENIEVLMEKKLGKVKG